MRLVGVWIVTIAGAGALLLFAAVRIVGFAESSQDQQHAARVVETVDRRLARVPKWLLSLLVFLVSAALVVAALWAVAGPPPSVLAARLDG